MAFNTYYTTTITTLEGNSLVYSLEQDTAQGQQPSALNITDKSYNLKYFFNDENSTNIGLGYLSKTIKLQFFGSDEVDDIKTNPKDWRLRITLDGDLIFLGYPDPKSISEFIVPSYSDLYECTFSNVFARVTNESLEQIYFDLQYSNSNPVQGIDNLPIVDFIGKFCVEDIAEETSLVWVAHAIESSACTYTNTNSLPLYPRPAPQLRYFAVGIPSTVTAARNTTIGELLAELAKFFYMRFGWSHSQGKTIISQITAGASGTYTGYDCTYSSNSHRTVSSSSNISLQSLSSSDFIADNDGVNSKNPIFPKRITTTTEGVSVESIVENPNTSISYLFDKEIKLDVDLNYVTDVKVFGTEIETDENGVTTFTDAYQGVSTVSENGDSNNYSVAELINKKLCTDYLFTNGLKGFRIELNKIIDPMIPVSYDSKVWITPSGTVNLYEETMECLLIEIQDNG